MAGKAAEQEMRQIATSLNAGTASERLAALRSIRAALDAGGLARPERTAFTNNHIHTTYSFSCYSPAAAAFKAYMSGLSAAGLMDHDSISGAREFIEAGDIIGITTTIGVEVRVSFAGIGYEGRVVNNPDEPTSAYIALHGVPHDKIGELDALLSRIRLERNRRNEAQLGRLNAILLPFGMKLDFERDVLPVSMAAEGGSVTERHMLFALAKRLIERYGRGPGLVGFLESGLAIGLSERMRASLLDEDRPAPGASALDAPGYDAHGYDMYSFDVLNVLKSGLVPRFFIAGGKDSLPVREMVDFARGIGAIPTYCYLGDVADSPTGDKRAQKFEDGFLGELIPVLKQAGFEAVAYMPTRNTKEQLQRVMALCRQHGFMEISGEDINQPRQSFVCEKLREPEFAHLIDSTWALVAHEWLAGQNPDDGIYSRKTKLRLPMIEDRIAEYRDIGLRYRK